MVEVGVTRAEAHTSRGGSRCAGSRVDGQRSHTTAAMIEQVVGAKGGEGSTSNDTIYLCNFRVGVRYPPSKQSCLSSNIALWFNRGTASLPEIHCIKCCVSRY